MPKKSALKTLFTFSFLYFLIITTVIFTLEYSDTHSVSNKDITTLFAACRDNKQN